MHATCTPESSTVHSVWGQVGNSWQCGNVTCSHNSSECAWFSWVRGPKLQVEVFDPFDPIEEDDVGFLSDSVFYIFAVFVAVIVPVREGRRRCPLVFLARR